MENFEMNIPLMNAAMNEEFVKFVTPFSCPPDTVVKIWPTIQPTFITRFDENDSIKFNAFPNSEMQ